MKYEHLLQSFCAYLLLGLMTQSAFAQNNAIFAGGGADGFSLSCFLQPSGNLIFAGSVADGFDQGCFQQASNNALFVGGIADGFSQACFLQPSQNAIFAGASSDGFDARCFALAASNNVFAGGIADGFSIACFAMSASNAIFAGGIGDGFDKDCFALAASNDIFAGGNSDGFVESCFFQPNNNLVFAGGIGDGFDCSEFLYSVVFAVELLSFDGVYDKGDARLTWITETEINNSHFDLERSLDGNMFEWITAVPGAGTSFDIQTYEYQDPVAHLAPDHKVLYYRLKQVDFDGTYHYSNVVELTLEALKNSVRIFPNPASETVFIRLGIPVNSPISMELFDLQGRQVRKITFSPDPRLNLFQFDVRDLAEGAYYCRVEFGESADEINTFKILIFR